MDGRETRCPHPQSQPAHHGFVHWHYAVAVGSVIVATLARIALDPLFGEKFPYISYMAAIIFVAWFGGLGPSLATLAMGFLLAFYFFASPRGSVMVSGIDAQVGALVYMATGLSSIYLSELMRGAEQRARRTAQELEQQRQILQSEIRERETAQQAFQNLLQRAVSVQEEERRRISRELHDECGQILTALNLELKMLEQPATPPELFSRRLSNLKRMTGQITEELHQLAVRLRPSVLDDLGLESAIANHLQSWQAVTGIHVDLECHGNLSERLSPEIETALYRVLQEALTNIARHSATEQASVVLTRQEGSVAMIIEDQGRGFPPDVLESQSREAESLGILGMRERMRAIGGTLEIESSPGAGTTVYARAFVASRPRQKEVTHD